MEAPPLRAQALPKCARAQSPDKRRFLVFFLQVGFISLEVGYTRAKNVRSTLLKNTVDVRELR